VKQWILDLFRQAWKEETIPKDREKNIIIPIHKKDPKPDAKTTKYYAFQQY
jgi:hypothetical protein